MKKHLILIFALVVALALCGCAAEDEALVLELSPMPIEESQAPIEENFAPSFLDAQLQGQWYGYWEIFSSTGAWGEMDKQRWDCCAEISPEDVLYIWDEDMDKSVGLVRLEINREENLGRVSGGWFMDLEQGYDNWRIKLKQDENGLLLILRGSYASEVNGAFSFVCYLRPWGDEWPEEKRPEAYEKLFYPLIRDGKEIPENFSIKDIYMNNMKIVDMHCDTLLVLRNTGKNLDGINAHINIDKMRHSGAMMQCFAIYTPTGPEAKIYRISETPWEFFLDSVKRFNEQMEICKADIAPMRTMADLKDNMAQGKISAMLTLEDATCLDGDISRVQRLYDEGVRLVTLTWNYENTLGFPNSADPQLHAKGLKDFGFEVISEMDRLGMAVDVSHLSEGGFYDVARACRKPFVASHSCARALCDHRRNLSDDQLRTLGDHGGVCGVNFYSRFLRPESEYSRNEDILRHMEYIADKAGMEAVALGSDFDGIGCDLEMADYAGLAKLCELIARRFGGDNADRIISGNALRAFGEILN